MFSATLRRTGSLLAVLAITLLMANAHCYMRCSLAMDESHCHPQGNNPNPACMYQHAISKRVVHQAPLLQDISVWTVSEAVPQLSVWAVEVAQRQFPPGRIASPVLSLRI